MTLVILSSEKTGAILIDMASQFLDRTSLELVTTAAALEQASSNAGPKAVLLSHSSSVIVTSAILERFSGNAINIHSASPDFPGRDPHHFAIYHKATRYGATLHKMEAKVDAGDILSVDLFDVLPEDTPETLLSKADQASLRLARAFLEGLSKTEMLPGSCGAHWGKCKTSRKDFIELCRLTPEMSAGEVSRRIQATSFRDYTNVWLDIWGRKFIPAAKDSD